MERTTTIWTAPTVAYLAKTFAILYRSNVITIIKFRFAIIYFLTKLRTQNKENNVL